MSEPGYVSHEVLKLPENLQDKASILFHFSPHDTEYDALAFRPYLDEADVYVPEFPRFRDEYKKILGRLAAGEYKAYERLSDYQTPFAETTFRTIVSQPRRRKLAIEVLDVPRTQYWINAKNHLDRFYERVEVKSTLSETLSLMNERGHKAAMLQAERDGVITNNIIDYLRSRDAAGNWPPTRPLNMLITLGSLHDNVFANLQRAGIPAEMTPNSIVGPGYHTDDLLRAHQAGQTPSDEMLKRAFVGGLLNRQEIIMADNTQSRILAIRKIVDPIDTGSLDTLAQRMVDQAISSGEAGLNQEVEAVLRISSGYSRMGNAEVEEFIARAGV